MIRLWQSLVKVLLKDEATKELQIRYFNNECGEMHLLTFEDKYKNLKFGNNDYAVKNMIR